MKKKNNRKAFTLTEVLVSVAIIVLLITLSVIATFSSRMHSRNSKRVNNVNEIMNALESYYAANQSYPTVITAGQPIMSGSNELLKRVPTNPYPRTDGGCPDQDYTYTTTSTGYKLTFCIGADHGRFTKGTVICKNGNCGVTDTDCGPGITVTDIDGNVYPTVQIGTQCWMGKNLYVKRNPDGSCINISGGGVTVGPAPGCVNSNGLPGWGAGWLDASRRDCIKSGNVRGSESDCAVSGALYTWPGAMNIPNSCINTSASSPPCLPSSPYHQGICPDGWHMPNDSEWSTLETYLTDSPNTCISTREYPGPPAFFDCLFAGQKLKVGGSSSFEAFYAGGRDVAGNSFNHYGCGVDYWSTNATNIVNANCLIPNYCVTVRVISECSPSVATGVYRYSRPRAYGFSVRCIKN